MQEPLGSAPPHAQEAVGFRDIQGWHADAAGGKREVQLIPTGRQSSGLTWTVQQKEGCRAQKVLQGYLQIAFYEPPQSHAHSGQ